MSHNDQNQPQVLLVQVDSNSDVTYHQSKDTAPGPYQVPPPTITHDDYSHKVPSIGENKFKGDGFWRGCCAGLCCYCCLDICF
ncbi:hypothetical protein VNO77_24431 [Canavalia gladiata]|uniref:Cysteine-rich transmembrane domain-containing protein n=1 Tax=Canavalia gladiata TaxID=3824 RepID=A0AAN9QG87_CANGL